MSCFVSHCRNVKRLLPPSSRITFHRFPKDEIRFPQWLEAIGRSDSNIEWNKHRFVCSEHFLKNDFQKSKNLCLLKKTAIPSLKVSKMVTPPPCTPHGREKFASVHSSTSDIASDTSHKLLHVEPSTSYTCISPSIITSSTDTGPEASAQIPGIPYSVSSQGMSYNVRKRTRTSSTDTASDTDFSSASVSDTDSSVQRKRSYLKVEHSYASTSNTLKKELEESKKKLVQQRKKLGNFQGSLKTLKIRLNSLKDIIKDLKEKNSLSENTLQNLETTYGNIPDRLMKKMMVLIKSGTGSGSRCPEEIREIAMTLHFYSARAYHYVRKTSLSSSSSECFEKM